MSKGDRITRSAYNSLQSQVASLIGVGSGQTGYGQQLLSRQANVGEVISSVLLTQLRNDLAKAWTHQTNTSVVDSTLIGPPNLKLYASGNVVTDFATQYNDFVNNATTGVLTRKTLAAAGQMTQGISISSTQRSTAWGTVVNAVSHTVDILFGGYTQGSLTVLPADHARVFFNAGGTIQISASRTSGSVTSKNTSWTNLLAGFGVFGFGATNSTISGTLNSGGILASTTGFFNLTVGSGPTTILNQTGSAGVYAENAYSVTVSRPTASTLSFTITFRDNDLGDPVDEIVDGILTSTVQCTRPSGANVDVPAPTGSATPL